MDYEYMIDFLNENTQLDFLMYSIDVIGIDEGVMDILIGMKNAMVNFFKKVGEFFSNMIHRITNKENVSAAKGEIEAKAIINKTDENCNIKPEKMPEVASKIEQVSNKSVERVAVIRKTVVDKKSDSSSKEDIPAYSKTKQTVGSVSNKTPENSKSEKTPTYSKAKQTVGSFSNKVSERPKPEKITLNTVFLKDQYVDKVLNDSDRIINNISKINKVISELGSLGRNKVGTSIRDLPGLYLQSDLWKRWQDDFEKFYKKPEKELYDTNYTKSPKELLKIITGKLESAKKKNNLLSININNGNKMLDESQKVIDNIKLDQMSIGWGYSYDEKEKQWKYYTGSKKVKDKYGFDQDEPQYSNVDKKQIKELQEFQYNELKKSFKEETECYRYAMNCFKITLSKISEEINRCNQYIAVIKSNM